jgi:EAL domain-containing protein (putative c-di-GMP-specific phosphodiesterase class I)
MYQAKRSGGGMHHVLDLQAVHAAADLHRLEVDLHRAQARHQLALAYQPVVRTVDGMVVGVEALLRWTHPDQGAVPALTAVRMAERNGLIGSIGEWVLQRACADRTRWSDLHPDRPLDVSVNISGSQLMSAGFCDTVERVLTATGMDPTALLLEVTEAVCIDDADRAQAVLQELGGFGVRLALDDFGTGYCSLTYLHRFPIHMVKIDQSFISHLATDSTARLITAAVTDLAHALGLTVTAEGVETAEQHADVVTIGCELSQGFLHGRPLTDAEVVAVLQGDRGPLQLA